MDHHINSETFEKGVFITNLSTFPRSDLHNSQTDMSQSENLRHFQDFPFVFEKVGGRRWGSQRDSSYLTLYFYLHLS